MTVSLDTRNLSVISTSVSTLLACMIIYILNLYVHLFLKLLCFSCLHSSLQKHQEFRVLPQWRCIPFRALVHSQKMSFINLGAKKKSKTKIKSLPFFLCCKHRQKSLVLGTIKIEQVNKSVTEIHFFSCVCEIIPQFSAWTAWTVHKMWIKSQRLRLCVMHTCNLH